MDKVPKSTGVRSGVTSLYSSLTNRIISNGVNTTNNVYIPKQEKAKVGVERSNTHVKTDTNNTKKVFTDDKKNQAQRDMQQIKERTEKYSKLSKKLPKREEEVSHAKKEQLVDRSELRKESRKSEPEFRTKSERIKYEKKVLEFKKHLAAFNGKPEGSKTLVVGGVDCHKQPNYVIIIVGDERWEFKGKEAIFLIKELWRYHERFCPGQHEILCQDIGQNVTGESMVLYGVEITHGLRGFFNSLNQGIEVNEQRGAPVINDNVVRHEVREKTLVEMQQNHHVVYKLMLQVHSEILSSVNNVLKKNGLALEGKVTQEEFRVLLRKCMKLAQQSGEEDAQDKGNEPLRVYKTSPLSSGSSSNSVDLEGESKSKSKSEYGSYKYSEAASDLLLENAKGYQHTGTFENINDKKNSSFASTIVQYIMKRDVLSFCNYFVGNTPEQEQGVLSRLIKANNLIRGQATKNVRVARIIVGFEEDEAFIREQIEKAKLEAAQRKASGQTSGQTEDGIYFED